MQFLKQSTVFISRCGPFVDSTDGVTAETGLTIAQADIQISKAGAAFAQTSEASPTTTHDADGWYQVPFTTTDTGTLGTFIVQIVATGALPVWKEYSVVPANVFDSFFSTDLLQVDLTQISSSATAADNLEAGALGLVSGAADAGCTTTSIVTTLSEATDDHFNGRIITFTSGVLLGQSTDILDYVGSTKTLTVTALTEAASGGDTFVIS